MSIDRRTLLCAGGALAAMPLGALRAQAFPSRPITLYCAFPAGGPTDLVFRALAEAAGRERPWSSRTAPGPAARSHRWR